jgi:hypothetical protein
MIISSANVNNNVTSLLPSVLATTNAESVSSRYRHIQTSDVIDALQGQGFKLVSQQGKRDLHSEHGLLLVNREIGFLDNTFSENFATVSLFNSHNGKSAVTLVSGFFRVVCNNGMITGNADQWLKIRHSEKGHNLIGSTVEQLPHRIAAFRDLIVKLQNTKLTSDEMLELAEYVKSNLDGLRPIARADDLLTLRRIDDGKADAWTLCNVMQENAVRGGIISANSGRRLRPVNRLNNQNRLTGTIVNCVEHFVNNLRAA